MASDEQDWKRRALDAEKRCLRVALGLEDALTFPARPMLGTAVRVSIAELRASSLPELTDEELVENGMRVVHRLLDESKEADASRGKTPAKNEEL